MSRSLREVVVAALLALGISACGGGGGSAVVLPSGSPKIGASPSTIPTTTMTIVIPSLSLPANRKYVSPATQSIGVSFATSSGAVALSQTFDVSGATPDCTVESQETVCVFALSLAPDTYVASVTTYSGPNGTGSVLSENQDVSVTIEAAKQNNLTFTLFGVPSAIVITPTSSGVTGSQNSGFQAAAGTMEPVSFTLAAVDSQGYTIVGSGAPTFAVRSSNSSLAVSGPSASSPDTFTITPPASLQTLSGTVSVTASSTDPSVCLSSGADCQTSFAIGYAPFAADDWIAFAHDFARTARETQSTGISAATVGQLQQRWHVTLPEDEPVYGSPVVYDGNMVIEGYWGNLYDLSTTDGHIIWQKALGGSNRGSPMIDTVDGIVFVGNRIITTTVQPSTLYALRLADGSQVWSTTMAGPIRAAPVYANGIVYEGAAGGDQPTCYNGGVSAYNALTGALQWQWVVNDETNPGGGGGVWGAIAYDGSQLVFGTGNTCVDDLGTALGVVSLNPSDGSMNWSYTPNPLSTSDDDTGGGVLLQNGTATFINKNGSFYNVSPNGTGGASPQFATSLGSGDGLGGFASPATDGSMYVIGAGLFAQTSARTRLDSACYGITAVDLHARPSEVVSGYTSQLDGISATGSVMWTIPMTSRMVGSAAVTGEIAFAGVDDKIDAIDMQSGSILWSFASSAVFNASPVIVPSGLYAADAAGNVYAYALPQTLSDSVRRTSAAHVRSSR